MAAKSNSKPKATKVVEVKPTEVEVNETATVEEPEVVENTVEEKVDEVVVEDDKTKEIEVVIEEPKAKTVSVEKEFTPVDKVIDNNKPVSIGYGYVHTWNGMEY